MSARKLLELLESQALLEHSVMAELRKQVAEGKGKVSAEVIAKALVEKGHLTKFQATKLVGQATEAGDGTPESQPDTKSEPKSVPKSAPKSAAKSSVPADDDLLGLAPFDDEPPAPEAPTVKPASSSRAKGPSAEEVVMLEDADALTPVEDAGAGLTPIGLGAATGSGQFSGQIPGSGSGPLDPFGGGLDSTGMADPFGGPDGAASAGGAIAAPAMKAGKKRETRWDTKLMLGGFGALAMMIFIGFLLVTWIMSEPAIKVWEAAEEAYNAGNFPDAEGKYANYLTRVGPKDVNASKARVRIHLTKLRNDVPDPERGLKTATDLLPQIDLEPDSSVARDEYPGILPQIAEGFIKRAHQAKDSKTADELVNKAQQARDLLYQPGVITSVNRAKIQTQLTRIDEDITLIKRAIAQDQELAQAVSDMVAAVDAADTAKGYQLHSDLLKKYPGLRNDAKLFEAVGKITARERTLVKVKQDDVPPLTTDEPRKAEFRVVLATRTGGDSVLQGQVACLRYGHTVYAIDAGHGKVLWSRHVGTTGRANPVRVSPQPDADVLVVDEQRHDLLRLKAADGSLVWCTPIGEPFTEPTVAGTRVYVGTDSGRLLEIDLEAGGSKRHLLIPQRLPVSPVVAMDRPRMYLVGEHSNLYVIHTDSMQCEDVIYLGHKPGAIDTPPLILMSHVFVAESPASDYSLVHSFRIRSQGEGPKLFRPQEAIRTIGRVVVPLSSFGNRRLLILTDRGEIRLFDVDGAKTDNTLTDTGKLPPTLAIPHVGYPLADGTTTLWLADDKLTKYTARVTTKELVRDPAITNVGDSFVAPLQRFGNYLIHARRAADSTGVTVACIHTDQPRKTIWQTQLGVPAARITVDSARKEIIAVSSSASLFLINGSALKSGCADQPVQSIVRAGTGLSFTEPIDFSDGVVAFFNPADNKQLLVYSPAVVNARLKVLTLGIQDGRVPCVPIAYRGGLLVPSEKGDVWFFKIADGTQQALPFRPQLEAGETVRWLQPAMVGAGGEDFVIVDGSRNIYRVGLKDQPQPNLALVLSNKLDIDLAAGLAGIGETVYGVVRSTGLVDTLVAISAKDLKVGKQMDLGGRVTWGPIRVGEYVMVVTDAGQLRMYDEAQQERWPKPAKMHGNPAGPPLVAGDHYLFAAINGAVWRTATATGEDSDRLELGEPLGAGPVAYLDRVLLCGDDGTLHVIPYLTGESPPPSATGGK